MLIQTQPVGLGYLMVDRGEGQLPVGVTQRVFEADTYTCTHCQTVVIMNPERKRERYRCVGCSHHICDPCAAKRAAGAPCRTMQQIGEEFMEAAARGLDLSNLAQAPRQAEASSSLVLP